jgi:Rrf2 family protein
MHGRIADKFYPRYARGMKLSDGVEQAAHCVVMLASLPPEGLLAAAALAEFHGVSPSYLLKHLQALSLAGIVESVPGPRGGYRLGRPASRVSLLDIVQAVEGKEPAFRCAEIRQRGPMLPACKPTRRCEINAAMLRAERAYQAELARITVADLLASVARHDTDGAIARRGSQFIALRIRKQNPESH